MKRLVSNFQILGAVALFGGALALQSCGAEKGCTDSRADNYVATAEEDDGTCNESETEAKFEGAWTFTIAGEDTYNVNVTTSSTDGDYRITAQTDLGFGNIAPVNVNMNVNQAIATSGMVDIPSINGQIDTLTLTYNSATSATLAGTLSGFDEQTINGSFSDSGTK